MSVGLYLRYTNIIDRASVIRLSSFRFEGDNYEIAHTLEAPKGKHYRLKCTCGDDNWTDNGRYINEYECDSCGMFLTAVEYKED